LVPAILTDFDDTAAAQNVAELLLKQFGGPHWQDVRQRFRSGELTLKEYQEITFREIQADRDTMQAYVKENANLRPHFGELRSHCRAMGFPLAIVSQGLDFYIQALLEKEGHGDVPVYSVNTRFTDRGITYLYHHTNPGQERQGNSKGRIVDQYRERGHRVYYVGDGRSDFEAAERADVVFAHSVLAEECQRQRIPYRPFRDFADVLAALRECPAAGTE
jgi:2-hydroxy-3-keto-5-methylthiopentenyl-1-phosphate phosphatase